MVSERISLVPADHIVEIITIPNSIILPVEQVDRDHELASEDLPCCE